MHGRGFFGHPPSVCLPPESLFRLGSGFGLLAQFLLAGDLPFLSFALLLRCLYFRITACRVELNERRGWVWVPGKPPRRLREPGTLH